MRRVLVNVSNHPSSLWSSSQLEGWDEVIDVPFPAVPAAAGEREVMEGPVLQIVRALGELAGRFPGQIYLHLTGEWFTVIHVIWILLREDPDKWILAWPASERRVRERIEDGRTVKEAVFEFKRWRFVPLAVLS